MSGKESSHEVCSVEQTYNTETPEYNVVREHPGLLREADDIFPLRNAPVLRKRSEGVLHDTSTKTCEENNAERDEVEIILAIGVLTRPWVVVAEREEF